MLHRPRRLVASVGEDTHHHSQLLGYDRRSRPTERADCSDTSALWVFASRVCFVVMSEPRDGVWNTMARSNPEPPDFFTVEEAARVLRIGRTAAYQLARTWRATGGREGLPVVAFGRLLRVPRAALEALSGAPISTKVAAAPTPAPPIAVADPVMPPPALARVERVRPSSRRHRRVRAASPD